MEDWTHLEHIRDFLCSFNAATLATEGRNSTLEKVLPSMDFLLAKYDKAIEDYKNDWLMLPCLRTECNKLEKYYCLSDSTPVYIAALVLHPRLKFDYIDKHWPKRWGRDARNKLKEFWIMQYKSTAIEIAVTLGLELGAENSNEFELWLNADQTAVQDVDELEHYLALPVLPNTLISARQWWLEPSQ